MGVSRSRIAALAALLAAGTALVPAPRARAEGGAAGPAAAASPADAGARTISLDEPAPDAGGARSEETGPAPAADAAARDGLRRRVIPDPIGPFRVAGLGFAP
ncbi:hypothetical protein ACLBXP_14195, partial [Methylobacterium sp. A54F]